MIRSEDTEMKKAMLILMILVLAAGTLASASAEAPRFVTVQEWLNEKGECGDCMLVVKVLQVLNPVLALAADETGTINLFSGGDPLIVNFTDENGWLDGWILVIANPRYNEYEGTVEMADWTLLRALPRLLPDED